MSETDVVAILSADLKHPGGRPSEYSPDLCEKVGEYILQCSDSYNGNQVKVKLPKREGFAKFIGVTRQTIDNWSKDHPEFFDALARLDEEQREKLIDNGLAGIYNPTIAKLLLSANHGMRERSDVTSDDKPVGTAEAIVAAIQAARK